QSLDGNCVPRRVMGKAGNRTFRLFLDPPRRHRPEEWVSISSVLASPNPPPHLGSQIAHPGRTRRGMLASEMCRVAMDSFRLNKVRFMLTAFGMIVGTASLILVVT